MTPKKDIKPRVEDGVPSDDRGIPVKFVQDGNSLRVFIGGEEWFTDCRVKRMAVELEAWRSGRLRHRPLGGFLVFSAGGHCLSGHDTIEAAVDALVAEREE